MISDHFASRFAQVRRYICFRVDAANTQHSYRTSENSKVIRLEVVFQIRFRFPFADQQGRILI